MLAKYAKKEIITKKEKNGKTQVALTMRCSSTLQKVFNNCDTFAESVWRPKCLKYNLGFK